mmetsp:Transcript_68754/g.217448  ORF Transcript_68754/g.217448 Transcript_68754/m.217448 type:complete len:269 (-) Transcript_68754:291-1097(-)
MSRAREMCEGGGRPRRSDRKSTTGGSKKSAMSASRRRRCSSTTLRPLWATSSLVFSSPSSSSAACRARSSMRPSRHALSLASRARSFRCSALPSRPTAAIEKARIVMGAAERRRVVAVCTRLSVISAYCGGVGGRSAAASRALPLPLAGSARWYFAAHGSRLPSSACCSQSRVGSSLRRPESSCSSCRDTTICPLSMASWSLESRGAGGVGLASSKEGRSPSPRSSSKMCDRSRPPPPTTRAPCCSPPPPKTPCRPPICIPHGCCCCG